MKNFKFYAILLLFAFILGGCGNSVGEIIPMGTVPTNDFFAIYKAENGFDAKQAETIISYITMRRSYLEVKSMGINTFKDKYLYVVLPESGDASELADRLTAKGDFNFVDSSGNIIISKSEIVDASPRLNQNNENNNHVALTLSANGKALLAAGTSRIRGLSDNALYTTLDNAPIFTQRITQTLNNNIQILSGYSRKDALWFAGAAILPSLPVSLTPVYSSVISYKEGMVSPDVQAAFENLFASLIARRKQDFQNVTTFKNDESDEIFDYLCGEFDGFVPADFFVLPTDDANEFLVAEREHRRFLVANVIKTEKGIFITEVKYFD